MNTLDLNKIVVNLYPKAIDCAQGHIGTPKEDIWYEIDDDRARAMKIHRCSHCGCPLDQGEYV